MAAGRARIQRVKFAVHDAIEGHRAGARADHRRENQSKRAPARPAAIVPRGDGQAASAKGRAKAVCGKRTKEAHFFNQGKHSTFNINAQHRSISQLRTEV